MRKAEDLPPSSCRTSRKSGDLTYPEPLGPPRPVVGDLYLHHGEFEAFAVKLSGSTYIIRQVFVFLVLLQCYVDDDCKSDRNMSVINVM